MKKCHMTFLLAGVIVWSTLIVPGRIEAQQTTTPSAPSQSAGGPAVSTPSGGASSPDPVSSGSQSDAAAGPVAPKSLPGVKPLASLLGMTLKQADEAFGPPEEVFPVRGQHAWEDDVVFYYPDHSYLFWFRDRVWQVRVDRRFSGTAIGVHMGESRSEVQGVLGNPFHVGEHSEIFLLPDRGFPVRARLFFTNDQLSDLYVYRGDF